VRVEAEVIVPALAAKSALTIEASCLKALLTKFLAIPSETFVPVKSLIDVGFKLSEEIGLLLMTPSLH
jgi:hypothetical protein